MTLSKIWGIWAKLLQSKRQKRITNWYCQFWILFRNWYTKSAIVSFDYPQKAEVIDNRTYLRFLSAIGFVDIAVGLANDSVPDIDDP